MGLEDVTCMVYSYRLTREQGGLKHSGSMGIAHALQTKCSAGMQKLAHAVWGELTERCKYSIKTGVKQFMDGAVIVSQKRWFIHSGQTATEAFRGGSILYKTSLKMK
jgi:hypothetical protein